MVMIMLIKSLNDLLIQRMGVYSQHYSDMWMIKYYQKDDTVNYEDFLITRKNEK